MQKLKPLQQVLICLVGLTILIVSLAIAVFFYKRKARSLKPRSSTELSNNQELSSDDSSSQHSRDPYTMKAPPALPQPEDSPPTNIPDSWMKFSKPTLQLEYTAPPKTPTDIQAEIAEAYLRIGLEPDPLFSSDVRTRDKAALELLENIVHQQALASASFHHDFEQFIANVAVNFYAATNTRAPSGMTLPSGEGSSWKSILEGGRGIINTVVKDEATDIGANQLKALIDNYGKTNPDPMISAMLKSLEKDSNKASASGDTWNIFQIEILSDDSQSNNLLAKILLKALENQDPALAGYVKIKPNLYVRYAPLKQDGHKILKCQHLWFYKDNSGTVKVTGRIVTRDLDRKRKEWIKQCEKSNMGGYTADENFDSILRVGPNYQGNSSHSDDAVCLYNAQAFKHHDVFELSITHSSPYTTFPWFLAYCAKACEILQSVKSPAELAFSSFAPLREITNAILRGETIYAEQFMARPSGLIERSGGGTSAGLGNP